MVKHIPKPESKNPMHVQIKGKQSWHTCSNQHLPAACGSMGSGHGRPFHDLVQIKLRLNEIKLRPYVQDLSNTWGCIYFCRKDPREIWMIAMWSLAMAAGGEPRFRQGRGLPAAGDGWRSTSSASYTCMWARLGLGAAGEGQRRKQYQGGDGGGAPAREGDGDRVYELQGARSRSVRRAAASERGCAGVADDPCGVATRARRRRGALER